MENQAHADTKFQRSSEATFETFIEQAETCCEQARTAAIMKRYVAACGLYQTAAALYQQANHLAGAPDPKISECLQDLNNEASCCRLLMRVR